MNLRIIKAGILDTVQDMGRYGWQHLGINPGGVMDKLSASLANVIAGNKMDTPVIELHFPASEFFFEQPALIAISGGDFTASINGEEIPALHPVLLNKYSILQFNHLKTGARAYLAIHGGIDIPGWLNSYSTHLKAAAGGFKGRALQKDDEVGISPIPAISSYLGEKEFQVLPWSAETGTINTAPGKIMVLPGNEYHRVKAESKKDFTTRPFTITGHSDRMGFRLKNTPLESNDRSEVLSSGVNYGTVQLLPDGQLIILMADHQTTGGYPRIAHVCSAELPRLAQMKPGEQINFKLTSQKEAEERLFQQERHLHQLEIACKFRLEEFFKTEI